MPETTFSQFEQKLKQANQQTPQCADNQFLLLRLFHHIHPRIINELNQALAPYHIQHHEWTALLMAYAAPDYQILPSTLSSLLDLTRTSLTRLSDDLVSKGLLRRHENRQDRRQIVLQLTPAGIHCIQTATPICAAARKQMLLPFSASERKQFEQFLRRLLAHLNHETQPESQKSNLPNFHQTEDTYLGYHSHVKMIGQNSSNEIQQWLNQKMPKFA